MGNFSQGVAVPDQRDIPMIPAYPVCSHVAVIFPAVEPDVLPQGDTLAVPDLKIPGVNLPACLKEQIRRAGRGSFAPLKIRDLFTGFQNPN